jgi:hypothetical protein
VLRTAPLSFPKRGFTAAATRKGDEGGEPCSLSPPTLPRGLPRQRVSTTFYYAQYRKCAFELRVPEKQLNRPEVLRASVDQRRFCPAHRMCSIRIRIETDFRDPVIDVRAYCLVPRCGDLLTRLGNRNDSDFSPARAIHVSSASRVCAVISTAPDAGSSAVRPSLVLQLDRRDIRQVRKAARDRRRGACCRVGTFHLWATYTITIRAAPRCREESSLLPWR